MTLCAKRRLLLVLLLINLAFIWGNSLLPPEQSNALSDSVTEALGGEIVTEETPKPERLLTSSHIRKLAHVLEFASLGVLGTLLARAVAVEPRRYLPCLALAGMTTALLDETIQLLSERTSCVKDVWIDCGGFVLGVLVTLILHRTHEKRIACAEQR